MLPWARCAELMPAVPVEIQLLMPRALLALALEELTNDYVNLADFQFLAPHLHFKYISTLWCMFQIKYGFKPGCILSPSPGRNSQQTDTNCIFDSWRHHLLLFRRQCKPNSLGLRKKLRFLTTSHDFEILNSFIPVLYQPPSEVRYLGIYIEDLNFLKSNCQRIRMHLWMY